MRTVSYTHLSGSDAKSTSGTSEVSTSGSSAKSESGDDNSASGDMITVGFAQVGHESDWRTASTKSCQDVFLSLIHISVPSVRSVYIVGKGLCNPDNN